MLGIIIKTKISGFFFLISGAFATTNSEAKILANLALTIMETANADEGYMRNIIQMFQKLDKTEQLELEMKKSDPSKKNAKDKMKTEQDLKEEEARYRPMKLRKDDIEGLKMKSKKLEKFLGELEDKEFKVLVEGERLVLEIQKDRDINIATKTRNFPNLATLLEMEANISIDIKDFFIDIQEDIQNFFHLMESLVEINSLEIREINLLKIRKAIKIIEKPLPNTENKGALGEIWAVLVAASEARKNVNQALQKLELAKEMLEKRLELDEAKIKVVNAFREYEDMHLSVYCKTLDELIFEKKKELFKKKLSDFLITKLWEKCSDKGNYIKNIITKLEIDPAFFEKHTKVEILANKIKEKIKNPNLRILKDLSGKILEEIEITTMIGEFKNNAINEVNKNKIEFGLVEKALIKTAKTLEVKAAKTYFNELASKRKKEETELTELRGKLYN